MLEAIRTPESSLEGYFLTYVNRANFHSLLAVSVIPFVTFSIQPQQSDTRKLYIQLELAIGWLVTQDKLQPSAWSCCVCWCMFDQLDFPDCIWQTGSFKSARYKHANQAGQACTNNHTAGPSAELHFV